eukprot:1679120-Pleurochrysis_carterae.AAC.3
MRGPPRATGSFSGSSPPCRAGMRPRDSTRLRRGQDARAVRSSAVSGAQGRGCSCGAWRRRGAASGARATGRCSPTRPLHARADLSSECCTREAPA